MPSQVDGLEFLARSGRYGVSLDSVAVYGHSYGGYMALMALAKRPDVFRLALAAAPVTFWEAYDTAYTERCARCNLFRVAPPFLSLTRS